MGMLDIVANSPKTAKQADSGIIEIGLNFEKEVVPLMKGEISEVIINRGASVHTFTKKDDDTINVKVEFVPLYDYVVCPAINGNKARIYPINGASLSESFFLEGTCLVLSEQNSSLLYSNGECTQSKDKIMWHLVISEGKNAVYFKGAEFGEFVYKCAPIDKEAPRTGKKFNDMVVRQ